MCYTTYDVIASKKILAHNSLGNPKIPLEIAGKDIEETGGLILSAIDKLKQREEGFCQHCASR